MTISPQPVPSTTSQRMVVRQQSNRLKEEIQMFEIQKITIYYCIWLLMLLLGKETVSKLKWTPQENLTFQNLLNE